jgi:hypothetical protein
MVEDTVPQEVITPAEGVTEAEQYLAKLCKRSFLSIWSYPNVFRDQGRKNGIGDGKELCDLLVVFENNIFIFSDKDCRFGDAGNIRLDWSRWYRKAVFESANQLFAAERWIREYPNKLFLDRQCKIPFPIRLPKTDCAIFHRIVVAHNGSQHCQEAMGGSGSLMFESTWEGDAVPFTVGQICPNKGYVHVFDDTTLNIVMGTLDTITDFTAYINKKEKFLSSGKRVWSAGEEEMLAFYLGNLNRNNEHDFVIKDNVDTVVIPEGLWKQFTSSPERLEQIEFDRISYAWDELIETFAFHAMTGTQYSSIDRPFREQEIMYRFMARESRTRRRMLAKSLGEVLIRSTKSLSQWDARVIASLSADNPYYVFIFLKRKPTESDKDYRDKRLNLLLDYCYVTKLKWPNAQYVVGIAMEDGSENRRSQDMILTDMTKWNQELEAHAIEIQKRLGLLEQVKMSKGREHEYPVDHSGVTREGLPSRNSLCKCGSGKRFGNCHGKAFNQKSRKK